MVARGLPERKRSILKQGFLASESSRSVGSVGDKDNARFLGGLRAN